VNVPIACGGVVVRPGDVIVADGNGVIVVPREGAADLVRKVRGT
jgi:regulator of RNase E activity RraA